MHLERIADGVPRFVTHVKVMMKSQVNEAFVFSEGVRNCKDFSITNLRVVGMACSEPPLDVCFRATHSREPHCQ
jgi:hypothetical protein